MEIRRMTHQCGHLTVQIYWSESNYWKIIGPVGASNGFGKEKFAEMPVFSKD
jgi:hypothetical protein